MNIGILGNVENNISESYSWFCRTVYEGFTLNDHNVFGLNYKKSSIDMIRKWVLDNKIDVVFTHLTFHNHKPIDDILGLFEELRSSDIKIIHTLQDARTEPRYNGDISFAFDMAFISQYKNVEKFQKRWKVPVHYWPYSSMTYNKMGVYKKELDFKMPVFPGNPVSHTDRRDFVRKLQNTMPIKIIYTKSPQDVRNKTLDFCASNDCILSLSTRYGLNVGYSDVRPWQYGGAGGILICRPHDLQEKLIPEDLYFTFNSYNNLGVEQVKKLYDKINNMTEIDKTKMRENIFNFIQKYHSSRVRMKYTMEVIEEKITKIPVFLDEI